MPNISKRFIDKVNFHQAFAEVILITFGVIGALGLQSWWDDRAERQEALDYLIALEQDFIESHAEFDRQIGYITGVFENIDQIFEILAESQTDELPDSFATTLGAAYLIYTPTPVTGTYEDMLNSGKLRLVENGKLRIEMAQYMKLIEATHVFNRMILESYYQLHAPFVIQHLVSSDFGWYTPETDTPEDAVGLITAAPASPYSINVAAVRSQEFWNLMFHNKTAYADQLIQMVAAQSRCNEILRLLRQEIELLSR